MSKITSKFQVTVPKRIAEEYGLQPGDEIDWVAAGEVIHVVPPGKTGKGTSVEARLELFDRTTQRLARRRGKTTEKAATVRGRGWRREDLYGRG